MTYNSVVFLKGIRANIIVSYSEAINIKKIYDDAEFPSSHVFDLKNKSFSKGEIKYIEVIKDGSRGEDWNKTIHDDNLKSWESRSAFLKMTPDRKAKSLEMFALAFKLFTGTEPSVEDLKNAEEAQLQFYRNNSNRVYCDFTVLSPCIPKQKMRGLNIVESCGVDIISRCISSDMHLSKKSYV